MGKKDIKRQFRDNLSAFVRSLESYVATEDKQWAIKGFIDVFQNIYTISTDTKIISKILELHLFPKLIAFAAEHSFAVVLAEHQNYYPDMSFVSLSDERIKFAVDLKTTYRLPDKPHLCNGFTLGSHGEYFINRSSRKNIQFPYNEYWGHFCLGAIYSRYSTDETRIHRLDQLQSIASVIGDFRFFVCEKWEIASDISGSGNTANIGSVRGIEDIVNGNGTFKGYGEQWFDDYWMNYGKITILDKSGKEAKIKSLRDFLAYRGYQQPK